jgi:hypothetical protein
MEVRLWFNLRFRTDSLFASRAFILNLFISKHLSRKRLRLKATSQGTLRKQFFFEITSFSKLPGRKGIALPRL